MVLVLMAQACSSGYQDAGETCPTWSDSSSQGVFGVFHGSYEVHLEPGVFLGWGSAWLKFKKALGNNIQTALFRSTVSLWLVVSGL